MKHVGKGLVCALALALLAYLLVVDYPNFQDSLEPGKAEASTAGDQEEGPPDGEAGSEAGLEQRAAELERELEELYQQTPDPQTALCFDQITDVIYSEVYPALEELGCTATVVFNDGWLTGDYERMTTAEFHELMDAGWEFAIGGDSELELPEVPEQAEEAWRQSLEEAMTQIQQRAGVTPTVYCFREGEYRPGYDAILEEWGFTTIRYSAGDAEADDGESSLTKVVGIPLSEGTGAAEVLEDLKQYPGAVLYTQVVAEGTQEENQVALEGYLALLEELTDSDSIAVTTMVGASEAVASESQEEKDRLAGIQEKERELEQLRQALEG